MDLKCVFCPKTLNWFSSWRLALLGRCHDYKKLVLYLASESITSSYQFSHSPLHHCDLSSHLHHHISMTTGHNVQFHTGTGQPCTWTWLQDTCAHTQKHEFLQSESWWNEILLHKCKVCLSLFFNYFISVLFQNSPSSLVLRARSYSLQFFSSDWSSQSCSPSHLQPELMHMPLLHMNSTDLQGWWEAAEIYNVHQCFYCRQVRTLSQNNFKVETSRESENFLFLSI